MLSPLRHGLAFHPLLTIQTATAQLARPITILIGWSAPFYTQRTPLVACSIKFWCSLNPQETTQPGLSEITTLGQIYPFTETSTRQKILRVVSWIWDRNLTTKNSEIQLTTITGLRDRRFGLPGIWTCIASLTLPGRPRTEGTMGTWIQRSPWLRKSRLNRRWEKLLWGRLITRLLGSRRKKLYSVRTSKGKISTRRGFISSQGKDSPIFWRLEREVWDYRLRPSTGKTICKYWKTLKAPRLVIIAS